MFRRLTALLLAFACVVTLALPAHEIADSAPSCCCADTTAPSTCCPRDCAPPPATPLSGRTVATAAEAAPLAAKPAARLTRLAFAHLVSFCSSFRSTATPARASFADRVSPAPSVALFQAHCSLRI